MRNLHRKKIWFMSYSLLIFSSCFLTLIPPQTALADDLAMQREKELVEIRKKIEQNHWRFTVDHNPIFDLPDHERQIMSSGGDKPEGKEPKVKTWSPSKEEIQQALSRDSFDWRNYNGHDWTTPISTQGCGDCYAHAACAVVESTMKIKSNAPDVNPNMSEQYIDSCLFMDCGGHRAGTVLQYFIDDGIVSESCVPYVGGNPPPNCAASRCSSWTQDRRYIVSYSQVDPPTEANIKSAILAHGPVASFINAGGSNFNGYSGGIIDDCDETSGSHWVVLVGWNDADDCWIAKNSWGSAWGESGWFRIEKGSNCRSIEYSVLWADPESLPDLTQYTSPGWDYPIVPRITADAAPDDCHLTTTLLGESYETYLNLSGFNDSDQDATFSWQNILLDDAYSIVAMKFDSIAAGAFDRVINRIACCSITGGRHTLTAVYDVDDNLWETDESNNTWCHQFVWSPAELISGVSDTRNPPPIKGPFPFNCDGYSFESNLHYWSAVAILPIEESADFDIVLCNDYANSLEGFEDYLAGSVQIAGASDFVLFNANPNVFVTRYAGVINSNESPSMYSIQSSISPNKYDPDDCPINGSIESSDILNIYTVGLFAGINYHFSVQLIDGNADIGISLYDGNYPNEYLGKSESVASANRAGAGESETLTFNCTDTGWYCFTVWKDHASDLLEACEYQLYFGPPTPTPTNAPSATRTPTSTASGTPTRTPTATRTPTPTPTSFTSSKKIYAIDPDMNDRFGCSVAIEESYAIVGAQYDSSRRGAAYAFYNEGYDWTCQGKLTPADVDMEDEFGCSVGLCEPNAIAGSHLSDASATDSGSAGIFKRIDADWSEKAQLLDPGGSENDRAGTSVSIDALYAAVGAPGDSSQSGSVSTFIEDMGWDFLAKLTAPDSAADDFFGCSVDLFGNILVIGAYGNDDAGAESGSAYVYTYVGSGWDMKNKLTAPDAAAGDRFGFSVAIDENYLIIGAPGKDLAAPDAGAAYVYWSNSGNWVYQCRLQASDPDQDDGFGTSVSISNGNAVIGAPKDDEWGSNSGAVYLFVHDGAAWFQFAKLTSKDTSASDFLGCSTGIDGSYIIAGAYGDDDKADGAGAAYIFGPFKASTSTPSPTITPTVTRTPTFTEAPTKTAESTPTGSTPTKTPNPQWTPTRTPTRTPSLTPSPTLTSIPSPGILNGRASFERPGITPPDPSCSVNITITLCSGGLPSFIYDAITNSEERFSESVRPGTYDILIKNDHSLAIIARDVTIPSGGETAVIDFGTLPEGDANNDNLVVSSDFFILRAAYNTAPGDPGYDDRADFNEDQMVTSTDFFLMRNHYNEEGEYCP